MATLDTLLASLAKDRPTGALRVGRAGTVFLDEGRITYMECAQTPGVERLLTARGRMPEAALRRVQADGGCERLLAEGAVTLGELQFCVLGAVLDAAFFLLPATGTRPKFRPGERHWLGGRWYFEVSGLVRECARRRAQLARIWPSADVDTAPVRPASRLPGQGVTLTAVQWEIITRADEEATPLDLARLLGRSGYSVLLAVRRLAASGLLTPTAPDPPTDPARSTDPPVPETARPESATSEAGGGRGTALPKRARGGGRRARHSPQDMAGAADMPRAAGAAGVADTEGPARSFGPAVTADPRDLALLMRLKKALEELA
ncbi:hypothetical protein GCM10010149_04550 [Nonomuraea roseoviolacea subsp. roseoviolacea]|uniref:hypothetical protein n=1 Tax=Nonomuraea roseoviolacea TaxID=103837 RepID=UPI0031D7B2C4